MIMKKALFFLAALFTLASCDFNEFSQGSGVGEPITFSANTYYKNGIGTRTEYSGAFFGTDTQYERINWVDNDRLRIWAQTDATHTANADYNVESHQTDSNNEQNSNAKVKSVGDPLTWLSDATHTIYALYPSPTTENVDENKVSLNANVITATIPATQVVTAASGSNVYKPDMNYAYMWAATPGTPGTDVTLAFKPLMTTFEFTVKTPDADGIELSSFVLKTDDESPALAGDFTAAISDDLTSCPVTSVSNGQKSITVNFGDVAIAAASSITFTIFALPQDLTHLTMQFNHKDGSVNEVAIKRRADADSPYEFVTFAAGTKYQITNIGLPGEGWIYTLEEVEEGEPMARTEASAGTATKTIKSYKTRGTEKEAVTMQFRYSPADEYGNCTNVWKDALPAWLTSLVVAAHTDGQNPDDPFTLTGTYTEMPLDRTVVEDETLDHIDILKQKGNNGADSENPQDLALYDIDNLTSKRTAGAKTANSYVVDRAGWYMFPLVYGNAIDCERGDVNGWNVGAYYDGQGEGWNGDLSVLHRFRNYLNTGIHSPYVLDDVNLAPSAVEAVIVWEDASEENLFIKANTVEIVEMASTAYKDSEGSTLASVPFIRFQVDPDGIRQGNAVIAVREKTGDQRIIWSWHIWVTDDDLTTVTVDTNPNVSRVVTSNQMLKVNLGWCDTKVITRYYFTPRLYYVEVTQAAGNEDPIIFAVSQNGDYWEVTSIGAAPFYQYGRKDPFLPDKGDLYNPVNKDSYSSYFTVVTNGTFLPYVTAGGSNDGNVSYGIQNPYIIYSRGSNNGWVASLQRNLWDMTETSTNGHSYHSYEINEGKDKKVVKTIYDPCPPGFSVPNYTAFTIFTRTGGRVTSMSDWNTENPETEDGLGYRLNTTAAGGEKILFPFQGFRSEGGVLSGPFYLMNSKSAGDGYSTVFDLGGTMHDCVKGNAYQVRPVKEME